MSTPSDTPLYWSASAASLTPAERVPRAAFAQAARMSSPGAPSVSRETLSRPLGSAPKSPHSRLMQPAERVDRVRLAQMIDSASSLDELADIGHQALLPMPRRAQTGDSEDCCAQAWLFWTMTQWAVAVADDGILALNPSGSPISAVADLAAATALSETQATPERASTLDPQQRSALGSPFFSMPPEEFAPLQLRFAKDFVLSLAQPRDFAELTQSMRSFMNRLQSALAEWCDIHWPSASPASFMATSTAASASASPSILGFVVRPTPAAEDAAGESDESNDSNASGEWSPQRQKAVELSKAFLGDLLFRNLLSDTPFLRENRKFDRFCETQRSFWNTERARLNQYLGECAHEAATRAAPGATRSRLDYFHDADPALAQADMAASLGSVAQGLCDKNGLRAVFINPVGGSRRALAELFRADFAFAVLAERSGLPPRSLGLGGLTLSVANATHLIGHNNAGHFSRHSQLAPHARQAQGELSFNAPFSALAHEWTHAWDFTLAQAVSGLLPAAVEEKWSAAREALRQVVKFDQPATPADALRFARGIRRTHLAWARGNLAQKPLPDAPNLAAYAQWPDFVLSELARFGVPEVKERAKNGVAPRNVNQSLRAVWRAIKTQGPEAVERRLQTLYADLLDPAILCESVSIEALARHGSERIHEMGKLFHHFLHAQKTHPHWGPMRWSAQTNARLFSAGRGTGPEPFDYQFRPEELLARAAESHFHAPGQPGLSATDPDLFNTPRGDEARVSGAAFDAFFQAARPAFEAAAALRPLRPAVDVSTPAASPAEPPLSWRPPATLTLRAKAPLPAKMPRPGV